MGHEIVYCFKCLSRLTGGEFEKGKAFRHGPRVSCKACLPDLLAGLSPEEQAEFLKSSTSRAPVPTPSAPLPAARPATTRRRIEAEPAAPGGRGKALALGFGAGAAAILVVGLVLLRAPAPDPAPPPVRSPEAAAEKEPGSAAVERAQQAAGADPDARLALWAEAVRATRGGALHAEALEAERTLLERRELVRLKERAALAEKSAALRKEAGEAQQRLTARAIESARRGDEADVKAAEAAVERLGYPELRDAFRAALDGVKPAAKTPEPPSAPPSAELLAYREGWRKAAALAAARDFDGAVAEGERAARDVKEEVVKAETRRDLEDFIRLRELYAEIGRICAAMPPGRDLVFEVFGDDGARRRLQGRLLRTWPGRAELSGNPTVFVELADLTAASLAEALGLARRPGGRDLRALSLLCAAEGDGAAAERISPGELARKYKDLVPGGPSRVPKRSEREREARRLFYDAERAYREPASRAEGVAAYRKLAAEFSDAAIVKGDHELVRRRAEEGREAFVGPDALKAGGTFKPAKGEKPESYWSSADDSEAEKAVENFLDFEFLAVAETSYKAWIYAGGCCGEVFSFSWQASDLLGPKGVPAAPGGAVHVPVRHGVSSVKAKHGDHLGPKSPKRWAWIALPLPKFPAPGVKRVRILTSQKGFSVACAFVTSTRSSPPNDAELKDRLLRSKEGAPDPSLAAWWRLDDSAAEASGRGPAAQVRGSVDWVKDGKNGGAARIGAAGWIEAPHQPSLNAFPFTAAAWVRTSSASPTMGLINKYVCGSMSGWQLQVHLGSVRAWYIRDAGNLVWDGEEGINGGPLNDGAWHHVAFAVDAEGGRLYVDGLRKVAAPWSGAPGPVTTTQALSLGRYPSSFGSGAFEGSLDDVRIYTRALGDAELKALHAGAGAPAEDARPWTPVFDGKSLAGMGNSIPTDWKLENGALVRPAGSIDAAQSREDFEDGEFRIRFDTAGATLVWLAVRQGPEGKYFARMDGAIPDKAYELIFTCKGDDVRAAIDGRPVALETERGRPKRGRLQLNFEGKSMRILSIDRRPLP